MTKKKKVISEDAIRARYETMRSQLKDSRNKVKALNEEIEMIEKARDGVCDQLEEMKKEKMVIKCFYCGEILGKYEGDISILRQRVLNHAAVCGRNPLVIKIKMLEAGLKAATKPIKASFDLDVYHER